MILVKPSFQIMEVMGMTLLSPDPLTLIERAGRTCYKSESRITSDSAAKFVKARIGEHESVIEHSAMTVKFICDRGVSHELVRHRLCSFSQESTRYCNYKGGVTFVIPPWVDLEPGVYFCYKVDNNAPERMWYDRMLASEIAYQALLEFGWTPQQARSVLPNSLKTEIVMTANFREWRHILKLRTSKAAHPQMQELMRPLLDQLQRLMPVVFEDISF